MVRSAGFGPRLRWVATSHPWYDGTIADFTEVRFLDAAGLRALVQAYKVLAQAGKALKKLRKSLSGDEATGVDVFADSLTAPLYWIASNAGLDGAVAISKVRELPDGHGLNAATLEYGDLIADGVIDPVKVTRSAVLNAASVARMVLTTETAIVDKPAEEPDHGHGGHGHSH